MQKSILETYNLSKALELKLWQDVRGYYTVYLGGLPVNIHTGNVATADDSPDDLMLNEHNMAYWHPTYKDAVKVYEQMKMQYIES